MPAGLPTMVSASGLRSPRQAADVTAAWLTEAFASWHPQAEVRGVTLLETIHGASTKLRLALDLNDAAKAAGISSQVILKAGFEEHSAGIEQMHRNEVAAYRYLAPSADVRTASCYFADCDETGRATVILEDLTLRGVAFCSLQRPIGYQLARGFLDLLARLHARWWNAPDLGDQTWLRASHDAMRLEGLERTLSSEVFRTYVEAPRGAATPQALKDPELFRHLFLRLGDYYASSPQLISHGDMHLGNLYTTAEGAPGVLDWQPRRAPWSNDVSYFLVCALDLPDRRRWEQVLLGYYLDRLRAYGVDAPDFDTAWLGYRKDVTWGFYVWLFNGFTYQSEANNTAACTRFATAMIDHDVVRLLA